MKSLFFPVPQRLSERDGAPRWSGPTPSCAAPTLVTDWGRAPPAPASRGAPHLPGSAASAGSSGTASACPAPCSSSLVPARSSPAAPCSPAGVGGGVRGVQAVTHGGGGCPWLLGPQRQIHSVLSFPFSPPDLPSIPCVFQLWGPGCPHQLPHARFETLSVKPGP